MRFIGGAFVSAPSPSAGRKRSRAIACTTSGTKPGRAVSRRAALAFLLCLPAKASAKIRLADPDALSRVIETPSGLQYFDITTSDSGPAASTTSMVTLHYTLGTTGARNGWRIDSSNGRDPLSFTVGDGRVIRGLEEGVVGMHPGGVRRLLIPPDLGYHSEKDRPVPAGFAEYQRFKNIYLNRDRQYQPDVVLDVSLLKVR